MNKRLEVPKTFQQQLYNVFESYINLKDALVNDDVKKASQNGNNILNDLAQVDMKLVKGEAHNHWMSLEKEIKSSAKSIANTSDIKEHRNHFKHLSSHLIKAVQMFGVNEKVYVEFCPMADNNNGAYWLSKEEKVINPYFGEAMLTCGEVKQVIE
jgi:Cu(I)/Ag(I) efflux system membrane fusion protein